MGLTPVEGLPGATRSGAVDPTLVFHSTSGASSLSRASTKDLHITKAEEILNKCSGWASLTGSTDFTEIVKGWEEGTGKEKEVLAFEIFVDRIVGYIGSYWTKLGGQCDALVFSGGIGEKSWQLRREVVKRVACLGFRVDERRNRAVRNGVVVSIGGERMHDDGRRVLVVRTDEEGMMARECAADERFWRVSTNGEGSGA
jgi:acetate kinase